MKKNIVSHGTFMRIGIVAGNGQLPIMLAKSYQNIGSEVFIALIDQENSLDYSSFNVKIFNIGRVGDAIEFFKSNDISQIIIIGGVRRPNFFTLRVDKIGGLLLAKIMKSKFLGDDKLLRIVAEFLENYGFALLSPKEILLSNCAAKKGILTDKSPSSEDIQNINIGIMEARKLGNEDLGQAVIVRGNLVEKEDENGTDYLIDNSRLEGGVLVKTMKPEQDERLDIPTIGEETIKNVAKKGLNGIAIEAGRVIVVDIEKVIKLANDLGIFLIGV